MGQGIVKLADDEYVVWSTVVDAPITNILTRDELREHLNGPIEALRAAGYEDESSYGTPEKNERRIERADKFGTSYRDFTGSAEEYIAFNRAGPNESCISLDEIREQYKNQLD